MASRSAKIIDSAVQVVEFIKSQGLEVRFSSEDSFRSDLVDLLTVYREVDQIGVDRVGIADTVGIATPLQVHDLVRTLRGVVSCDIEFHGHNDTGCAIANSYCALAAGATHVDTSVLGIGERNGITPLGGLVARMYAQDPDQIRSNTICRCCVRWRTLLPRSWALMCHLTTILPVTQLSRTRQAFMPRRFLQSGYLRDPGSGGLRSDRYLHIAHRLTGWNAVKQRAEQLQLDLTDPQVKEVTAHIKVEADQRKLSLDDVDVLLREYHSRAVTVAPPPA